MAQFMAVYTMQPEDLAKFRAMAKAEQDAVDAKSVTEWGAWEKTHAAKLGETHMVGKTLRVTKAGTAPATNTICGYVLVEAETIDDAAKIFPEHPHIQTFPGDAIDIMPCVT
ncbi:MAG: hypothetical protein GX970_06340 [Phyllobacteriaceae bacterium]|nr:hypothetical protein [Phyllobacteriaceae bacterium]